MTATILIGGADATDAVTSWEVRNAGGFCLECSLALTGFGFFSACDPAAGRGTLKISLTTEGQTYAFMIEERQETLGRRGIDFTVWGRSKQAWLDVPYSDTITDDDTTSHPWQSGDCTSAAALSAVLAYAPAGVIVTWNAPAFTIREGALSVQGQSPINVIRQLAQAGGAALIAQPFGSLTVESYSVDAESATPEAAYTDADDIVALSARVEGGGGYDCVTVYGYSAAAEDAEGAPTSANMSIVVEKTTDDPVVVGEQFTLDIMHWHPEELDGVVLKTVLVEKWTDAGGGLTVGGIGRVDDPITGLVGITEEIALQFGSGNRSYPRYQDGGTRVSVPADGATPYSTTSDTYECRKSRISITANAAGEHRVVFYYEQFASMVTYTFTAQESAAETRDITIKSQDYSSGVPIAGDAVTIDGEYVGVTDASGEIAVSGIAVGSHTIAFSKSGYKDSDADSLANDTFEVT